MDQPGSLARRTIRCPVCGDEMAGKPWTCERCRTPHHEECVRYFGGCAIYGCRDGCAPTRLEVETWPRAFELLRRFAKARRMQSVSLVVCVVSLLGVLFGGHLLPTQAGMFCTSIVTVILGACGYLALDLRAGHLWKSLRRELGEQRSASLEVRPERVRGQMPRTGDRWSRFDWLMRGGLAIGAMAAVGAWFAPSVVTWTLAYVGIMAVVGARQLRRHTDEVELSLRRFEATYAPRLEKGKSDS